MFGSAALEVLIGLIFIFILVSIICSAVREAMEAWLKTRAAYLEHAIRELLNYKDGTGLAKSLYEHPLVYSLFSGNYKPGKQEERPAILANGDNLPSYIPFRNFALALMDITARGPECQRRIRTQNRGSYSRVPTCTQPGARWNCWTENLGRYR